MRTCTIFMSLIKANAPPFRNFVSSRGLVPFRSFPYRCPMLGLSLVSATFGLLKPSRLPCSSLQPSTHPDRTVLLNIICVSCRNWQEMWQPRIWLLLQMLQKRCGLFCDFAACCRICICETPNRFRDDTTLAAPNLLIRQAPNDDRSLAASAAAKGLAAATDVALQQLMSPEDRVRE